MYLTDAQLMSEIRRCEYCDTKPCKTACPCDCLPADFMMAASGGQPSDFKRAAGIILASNPLGGICGDVCPDHHCVAACLDRGMLMSDLMWVSESFHLVHHKQQVIDPQALLDEGPGNGR